MKEIPLEGGLFTRTRLFKAYGSSIWEKIIVPGPQFLPIIPRIFLPLSPRGSRTKIPKQGEVYQCLKDPPCGPKGRPFEWRRPVPQKGGVVCPNCRHLHVDWLSYWCDDVYLQNEPFPAGTLRLRRIDANS